MKTYTIPVGSFQTNCYVIASEQGNAVIIDPGSQGDRISKGISILGIKPLFILLTHGHHDHIGGIKALREEYPGIQVMVGQQDAELLRDVSKNLANTRYEDTSDFDGLMEDRILHEGEELVVDELRFTVIETPGHTPGGVTFRCGDTLFTGDTLFCGSVGRTDLYGGEMDKLTESVKKLYALDGNFAVLPGHGEPTNLDFERENNPYVRAQ